MKTTKRLLCLLVALVMLFSVSYLVACNSEEGLLAAADVYTSDDLFDAGTYGTDYDSQWDMYGASIAVDSVYYNDDNLPVAKISGVETELGMDYLSYAMVYATETSESLTATEEYNLWFQYYCVRWNYLMPSIPLYSNQYFDVFSSEIDGFATTAYWDPANAIVNATTEADDSTVLIGNITEMAGTFGLSSWGTSSIGSTDLDVIDLINGYSTLYMDTYGAYDWDSEVVESHSEEVNTDGTKTFTVTIVDGLVFNDGSAITAENYVLTLLVNSTEVAEAGGGSGYGGMSFDGYSEFYKGTSDFFSGIKLSADKMTYSVTVSADYIPYYYDYTYAGLTPTHSSMFFGTTSAAVELSTTAVTEGGVEVYACGLNDAFYAQTGTTYDLGAVMKANIESTDGSVPTAGPYMLTISSWDATDKTCVLEINTYFAGESLREVPTIKYVGIVYVTDETMIDTLSTGGIDMLTTITGGDDTDAALALVTFEADGETVASTSAYDYVYYDRAGYGNISFRSDFGPTMYTGVRQAISYTIDTAAFAQAFTGGYGSVVYGPFGVTTSGYVANEDTFTGSGDGALTEYAQSEAKALAAIIEAGFVFNGDGTEFVVGTDTVRYVLLEGIYLTEENMLFGSTDGLYYTTAVENEDGSYSFYMPLVLNWFGSTPNDVTDMLVTYWQTNSITSAIGMYITQETGDFTPLLAELYQYDGYGWDGTSVYSAFNLATGFTSSIYDYSWNWTIDPGMFDDYSAFYLMDTADFVWAD